MNYITKTVFNCCLAVLSQHLSNETCRGNKVKKLYHIYAFFVHTVFLNNVFLFHAFLCEKVREYYCIKEEKSWGFGMLVEKAFGWERAPSVGDLHG